MVILWYFQLCIKEFLLIHVLFWNISLQCCIKNHIASTVCKPHNINIYEYGYLNRPYSHTSIFPQNTRRNIYLYMHKKYLFFLPYLHDYAHFYIAAKAPLYIFSHFFLQFTLHSLTVCALYAPKHTHPNALDCQKRTLHTHMHERTVLESPWHYLPPISAASLIVQVAATMATILRQYDLWTYIVPTAHSLIHLWVVLKDKKV